jgi:hypothetical protein
MNRFRQEPVLPRGTGWIELSFSQLTAWPDYENHLHFRSYQSVT